jgi:hypothetical protein
MAIITHDGISSQGIFQEFFDYLAPKPYCTNFLGGLTIRPKALAVKHAYIQPNPITRLYWLVFDIDRAERFCFPNLSVPDANIEVVNPANNHQHLFYLIDPAVYTLRQARQAPLKLAADVDKCLTILLDADPGYGKLIAKNPLHERWVVHVWRSAPWELNKLLCFIPENLRRWKPKPSEMTGLGRNCELFEKTRHHAYSAWKRLNFARPDRLFDQVREIAGGINADFAAPLDERELLGIVRSITRWTTRHLTADGFQTWGDARRTRSIDTRRDRVEVLAAEAQALYASGKTHDQIALALGVNRSRISQLLNS